MTDPEGLVLLVRNQGEWWLPGGRVEYGESFVAAAVRETGEETGLAIEADGVVQITQEAEDDRHVVYVTVRGRVVGGRLRVPEDDPKVDAVCWESIGKARRLLRGFARDLDKLASADAIAEVVS